MNYKKHIIPKRIIVGEDEPLIIEHLKSILHKLGYEVAGTGRTESEILKVINTVKADLILLDINLGGKFEGISIGAYIQQHLRIPFIYVTAHSDRETLQRALHTQPSSYIVKPFKASDIYTAIELALHTFKPEEIPAATDGKTDGMLVKSKHGLMKVQFADILYVKAEGNYSMLHTLNAKFLLRGNLTEIMADNLNPDFIRVHKSYLVNIRHIKSVGSKYLTILGDHIPVGRTYRQVLLSAYSG